MDLVIDANIIVSAFLRSAVTRELLLSDGLVLRMPEHGRREVEKVLTSTSVRKRLGNPSAVDVRNMLSSSAMWSMSISVAATSRMASPVCDAETAPMIFSLR